MPLHRLLLLALTLPLLVPTDSRAAPVLDQASTGHGRSYGGIGGELERAQTFTVGIGGRLSSFDVSLSSTRFDGEPDYLTWAIFGTTDGIPDETPLVNGVLQLDGLVETVVSVELPASTPVFVTPGQVLAFGVGNTAATLGERALLVFGAIPSIEFDSYLPGSAFLRVTDGSDPRTTWTVTDFELRFATYVDTPEPGALALLGAGALWLALAARGRVVRPTKP